jgi:hypothetical protein
MTARAMTARQFYDDDNPDGLYDPYWLKRGRKIVRDGGRISVGLMLTDNAPHGSRAPLSATRSDTIRPLWTLWPAAWTPPAIVRGR